MKVRSTVKGLVGCVLFCAACNHDPEIDQLSKLTREDYKYTLVKDKREETKAKIEREDPGVPSISKLLVSPPPPPMGNGRLISFSVTEEVPLKDILIELARLADIDIEIDPTIEGGIILKVKQKPLKTVVERICELGSLRYSYTDNILRFEKDNPYNKNYVADFLVADEIWTTLETSIQNILTSRGDAEAQVSVNKPASMITVFARHKSQEAVSEYIEEVKKNYSAQVLIEAKVVEVKLDDEYKAGINWNFATPSGQTTVVANNPGGGTGGVTITKVGGALGGSLSATIDALEYFGTTKTLSNPRIHAINNKEAKLEFTNTVVYFDIEIEEETDSDTNVTTDKVTATKQEEIAGITLTITPSIDLTKQEVTLDVVPELKAHIRDVKEPNTTLEEAGLENLIPVIETRKMQTSVKLKSGQAMVIGGLMSENTQNSDTGIPFIARIPILGHLFKGTSRDAEIRETVIFIKATIIDPEEGIGKYDREFYDKFSLERKPL